MEGGRRHAPVRALAANPAVTTASAGAVATTTAAIAALFNYSRRSSSSCCGGVSRSRSRSRHSAVSAAWLFMRGERKGHCSEICAYTGSMHTQASVQAPVASLQWPFECGCLSCAVPNTLQVPAPTGTAGSGGAKSHPLGAVHQHHLAVHRAQCVRNTEESHRAAQRLRAVQHRYAAVCDSSMI
eukprot:SAG11_NODE_1499_length_4787_cov_14.242747_4_plen_184_part_00